jgi:hypothetical protein
VARCLVGSVGRTDLLGDDATEELTREQFRSLRALASLPDDVAVWPTHGSGSFCAAGPMLDAPTSTIGAERFANPLFAIADAGAFHDRLVSGFMPYPAYYREMAPMNRAGPRVLGGRPSLVALDPTAVAAASRTEHASSTRGPGARSPQVISRFAHRRAPRHVRFIRRLDPAGRHAAGAGPAGRA